MFEQMQANRAIGVSPHVFWLYPTPCSYGASSLWAPAALAGLLYQCAAMTAAEWQSGARRRAEHAAQAYHP